LAPAAAISRLADVIAAGEADHVNIGRFDEKRSPSIARVLELPEIAAIRAITDQRTQLARLAHLSRGILERTALAHRILRNSGTADPALAEFVAADRQRRHRHQTAYIAMLLDNGPLREGMSEADAAATYGALANPDTYAELSTHRGWSPDHYENWLSNTLTLLLLPHPPGTTGLSK
jgi:hypothetical protein